MVSVIGRPTAEGTAVPGSAHFGALRLLTLARTPLDGRGGAGESVLLILTGTHDVAAGGGSWIARGLRETVFEGRPSAVFLPPACPWRLSGGTGEALLVEARLPEAEPMTPQENLAKKVLLPIAGSGKAFDPVTGDWKRQEDFPLAPEAILPRRITTAEVDGKQVEFVFPAGYKAQVLCAAEARLLPGESLRWPDWRTESGSPWRRESVYFLRSEGRAAVTAGSGRGEVAGDGSVFVREGGSHRIEALEGRCYVAAFFAGPEKRLARVP